MEIIDAVLGKALSQTKDEFYCASTLTTFSAFSIYTLKIT